MKKMKLAAIGVTLALAGVGAVTSANAQTLVFDRGLPTANLNNAAGSSRSNVQWADSESTTNPATFWVPGDDFTLAGSGAYSINKIRVWSANDTGLSLLGGVAGGSIGVQSSTYTATPITYVDGKGYQGNSGSFSQIYQIDFSVNIALNGGQTYQFFLDGSKVANPPANGGGYVNAFLHASNKDVSGSTQQGADNYFLWLAPNGSVQTWVSGPVGGGTTGWGAGWDKASDANVQVFAVPEPETYAMMLTGLTVLGFIGRRRKAKVAAA